MGCHDAYCGSPPFKPPCNAHGQAKINWQFPPELERDYGEPVGWGDGKGGYCVETSEEVFERSYAHAHVRLSCKDGSSKITMKADDGGDSGAGRRVAVKSDDAEPCDL